MKCNFSEMKKEYEIQINIYQIISILTTFLTGETHRNIIYVQRRDMSYLLLCLRLDSHGYYTMTTLSVLLPWQHQFLLGQQYKTIQSSHFLSALFPGLHGDSELHCCLDVMMCGLSGAGINVQEEPTNSASGQTLLLQLL